jgi:drug/metabolite transporter (DMT)-like permease
MKLKISFVTPAQRLARWEKIKQGGIWRFVLCRGVLGWGLSCAIIMMLVALASDRSLPVTQVFGAFLAGGFVVGVSMWFFTMWLYSRAKKRNEA